MQIEPYLFFAGHCEEALAFYKSVMGGDYELNRFAGSPMESEVGPDWAQKIMHATFKGDGFTFMASDSTRPLSGRNVALSLAVTGATDGKALFDGLANGGEVMMPYAPAFWGGNYGMLVDRYGIEWMVSGHERSA